MPPSLTNPRIADDRFGNRWQQNSPAGSIYTSNLTFTGNATNNNNRMDLYSYDSAGNLLNDNVHQYFYDAENRLIQVDGSLPYCTSNGASGSAATACYYYDADGKRVRRTGYAPACDSVGIADYVFDLEGRVIVENNSNGTACDIQVYAGDRHFGRQGGGSFFYHSDWLGTVRKIISDQFLLNSSVQTCTSLPFGDGLTCNSNYGNVWHFTGKERDSESNLDNFGARYDASSMGRFMTPDPLPWIDWQHGNEDDQKKFDDFVSNPQNFNMYSYVDNNPLNKTDPTGMQGCKAGDKTFTTCTITIVYDPKTSKGTITVTGQNKGDKDPTVLLTGSVVVGGDGHVTPTGTFTAKSWEKDHVSTKYGSWANTKWSDSSWGKNVFGPFQLHIQELDKEGIYIHGTLGPSWSPTTWGNTVVGGTSHGCIRLCNQDDIALHNLMPNPQGNQIIIRTTPKPATDDDQ